MVTVVFYELDRLVGLLLVENPFPVLDTLNQNFIDRFDPFTGPNTPRRDRVVVFKKYNYVPAYSSRSAANFETFLLLFWR